MSYERHLPNLEPEFFPLFGRLALKSLDSQQVFPENPRNSCSLWPCENPLTMSSFLLASGSEHQCESYGHVDKSGGAGDGETRVTNTGRKLG